MQGDTTSLDQHVCLINSDSASNLSRLSCTTIKHSTDLDPDADPDATKKKEQHLDQDQQLSELQTHRKKNSIDDIHKRSHSLRSHTSQNTSSNDTHDTHSPFESVLARSGSWASTTPTSPETEICQVQHSNGEQSSSHHDDATLMATPVLTSHSSLYNRDDTLTTPHSISHNSPLEEQRRISGLISVGKLATLEGGGVTTPHLEEEDPISECRQKGQSASISRDPISNRNKPLPIPAELANIPSPSGPSGYLSSSSPIPTLSISPANSQEPKVDLAEMRSNSSSTTSNNDSIAEQPHKNSLRSMLNRSSKLFRASTGSRGSKIYVESPVNQDWEESQKLQSNHLTTDASSDSSLPYHQASNSPSPNASQSHLSSPSQFSDRSQTQFDLSPFHSAGPSKVSPPITAPRSHSPFTFRRGTSWIGGSKLDYLQERHLKAPSSSQTNTSPLSSSSSSSASHSSSNHDQPKRQQSTSSMIQSFRQSRFSYRPSPTEQEQEKEDKYETPQMGPPPAIDNHLTNSTVRAPTATRPRLNRNRSKSMDVLERFKGDPRVAHIVGKGENKCNDSIAVGTTSIIEVDAPLPKPDDLRRPLQDRQKSTDKSRFSQLLTRKSSAIAVKEASVSSSTPFGAEKEESIRHFGSREGAMSRLTESILKKRSFTPTTKTKSEEAMPQIDQESKPERMTNHRRNRSSVSSTSAFASAHSTLTRSDRRTPSSSNGFQDLEEGALGASEEQANGELSGIKKLRAAQLAVELSVLDAPEAKSISPNLSSSAVESRIASKPLPSVVDQALNANASGNNEDTNIEATKQSPRKSSGQSVSRLPRSINHTRSRTLSFTRFIDPFRGSKSRPPSREGHEEEEKNYSRKGSIGMSDSFASALSHAPSTDDHQELATTNVSSKSSPEQMRASTSFRAAPPSSYRGLSSENLSEMTKSESDPVLNYSKKTRSASMTGVAQSGGPSSVVPTRPTRRSSQASERFISPVHTMTAISTTISKKQPLFTRMDSAVSDSEDDPLPPPRLSSRRGSSTGRSTAANSLPRRRALSKPSLTIDTKLASTPLPVPPVRPSSALGMTAEFERGNQKNAIAEGGGRAQHRPSQPTLSIADDLEFLKALEEVRRVNQDRIKKQEEEASMVQQMARMGMASGNKRVKAGGYAKTQTNFHQRLDDPSGQAIRRIPMIRRSSSADGRFSSMDAPLCPSVSPMDESSHSPTTTLKVRSEKPSPLELGVGKASGKLRDGAFLNDDDWKREVKALFVIRELVLTERSYARHLEALLHAVRALYPPASRRHMSTGASLSRSTGPPPIPTHITLLRNLLPQLIALSRTLANRIDENPTAAGVGAAFSLVSNQMEASFVAWSSVVQEIMDALRISEKSKSKGKDRIGLITPNLLEQTNVDNQGVQNGFVSVPTSPTSLLTSKRSMGFLDRRQVVADSLMESPTSLTFGESVKSTATKRRSTMSGVPPSFAANLRAKASASMNSSTEASRKKTEDSISSSSSQSIGKRGIGAVVSSSKPVFPSKAKAKIGGSSGWDVDFMNIGLGAAWSKPTTTLQSIVTAPTTPTKASSTAMDHFGSKKLSAMDVAIMPTQRIPRYILLLRDLNSSTPPQSLSHVRLLRSLDFVRRVANKCDRASKGSVLTNGR